MRFKDLLRLAWGNLWRIKIRTILTVGGVVIGITFMVIMVSIGIGLERSVTGQLTGLVQMNIVEVSSFGGRGMPGMGPVVVRDDTEPPDLDQRALQAFKEIRGVTAVTPLVNVYSSEIRMGRDMFWFSLIGMDFSQLERFGFSLEEGEGIPRGRLIVLAGYRVPEMVASGGGRPFFGEQAGEAERADLARRQLEITVRRGFEYYEDEIYRMNERDAMQAGPEEKIYRVRVGGILQELNSWNDYNLIIPLEMAEEIYEWQSGQRGYFRQYGYDQVQVFVENVDDVVRVQETITEMGFYAFSMKQMLEATGNVFLIMQFVMGGIGGIALLISGVGIVNTLIMSIYERTREIGIIKVVGASIPDIRNLFLLEAGFIGLIGGIIGVSCGWLAGLVLNYLAVLYMAGSGMGEVPGMVHLPLPVALFTVLFSMVIGIIAGLYPALKAANLSAIEAIRHE